MKKYLFIAVLLTLSLSISAQSVYRVHKTEMYIKDRNGDWELYSKNSDTKIQLCVEDDFITIWAKSPSMYKIYRSEGEDLNGKTFTGKSYPARELKKSESCIVHVINMSGELFVSVINKEYNLRFYLKDE